eukprot:178127-Chlamydomonas_euryale.AAC.1
MPSAGGVGPGLLHGATEPATGQARPSAGGATHAAPDAGYVAGQAPAAAKQLRPSVLARTAWALARMDVQAPADWWSHFLEEVQCVLGKFHVKQLSQVGVGVGRGADVSVGGGTEMRGCAHVSKPTPGPG